MSTQDNLADALREIQVMAADADLRATHHRTALETISRKAREALAEHDAQPAPDECFCDRMYPDSNPNASCGDCPTRDYGAQLAPAPVQVGAGELPAIALSEAADVLRGMGYRWVNATWAPYLPDVAPGSGSGDGAHNRLAAIAALRQPVPDAVRAVLDELERATSKFPTWPTDPLHAVAVVSEEAGELVKAVLQAAYEPHKSTPEDVATEAIQTAAMALRFIDSLPRYAYARGEQHSQQEDRS